jgi:hypothetical protein
MSSAERLEELRPLLLLCVEAVILMPSEKSETERMSRMTRMLSVLEQFIEAKMNDVIDDELQVRVKKFLAASRLQ